MHTTSAEKRRILLYSTNIWYFAEGMLGPLLAVFTNQIGGNIFDITWAWAIYLVVAGCLTIIVGYISDYVSKEKLMISGYMLNAAFTIGYIFVENSRGLFIVQAGLGIASALATPTWDALYTKYSEEKKAGYIWGLHTGQMQIISGIAIITSGAILNYFSFKILFMIMGLIQIIAALYQMKILNG